MRVYFLLGLQKLKHQGEKPKFYCFDEDPNIEFYPRQDWYFNCKAVLIQFTNQEDNSSCKSYQGEESYLLL